MLFKFEAKNLTVRGSTTKDGPIYRFSLEVEKEIFDSLISTPTGTVWAIGMAKVDYDNPGNSGSSNGRTAGFEPVNAGSTPAPETKKPRAQFHGTLFEQAVKLCKNPAFWRYMGSIETVCSENQAWDNEAAAAALVKTFCGVQSRRDLDKTPESARKFGELLENFETWKNQK